MCSFALLTLLPAEVSSPSETSTAVGIGPNTITVINPESVEQRDFAVITRDRTTQQQNDTSSVQPPTDSTQQQYDTTSQQPEIRKNQSTHSQAEDNGSTFQNSDAAKTESSSDINNLSRVLQMTSVDRSPQISDQQGTVKHGVSVSSSRIEKHVRLVPALFVFGGMDTSGHIHGDCFILCLGD